MRAKKGFTLIEISVALGVFAIVMAMLTLVFVSVQKFSAEKERVTIQIEEVQLFKQTFQNVFENYQFSTCVLIQNIQPQNYIEITTPSGVDNISFNKQTLMQNETKIVEFKQLQNVLFSTNVNIIKCSLTFAENHCETLIFNKRA